MSRTIQLSDESLAHVPGADTALSEGLLRAVARGAVPETLRLYRPAREVAFGPADQRNGAYGQACQAAREAGFAAIERLAGGKAAVFHEDTIAFAWAIPADDAREGITRRYVELSSIVDAALRRLGVDAQVGEVAGEYCPGAYSVNAGGARKLMGVGQRVVGGAAHVGGVIVIENVALVNDALTPVYAALGYEWEPDATGSVADECGAGYDDVVAALVAAFAERYQLVEQPFPGALVRDAEAGGGRFVAVEA